MIYQILLLLSPAAEPALQRFAFAENHMGTRFRLVFYAPDEAAANRAAQAAFARIAELDGIMSDYKPTSELMQLCKKSGGAAVPVGADLFAVLEKSQALARKTDGAFDVTLGPLTKLWRQTRRTQLLPDQETLAKAKELVGFDKVELDPKAGTVRLKKAGMQLDLGGIAKGYAADQVLLLLKKHGIDRALVAAGGDIAVGAPPPDAAAWKIGIEPLDEGKEPGRFIYLKNAAVSTSGDAEQFVEIAGQRYSHILDPKTGLGLVGRMSVTVIAPNGTMADSLTKPVCVLGPDQGLKLIEETDGAACLIVRKTDKGEEVIASKRFPKQP